MRMELWIAGMDALTILPRPCLASVAVVCPILTRELCPRMSCHGLVVLGMTRSAPVYPQ